MILLDEIDVKEKDKRETLPPYSPQRSLAPAAVDSQLSLTSTVRVQSNLHPRSASVHSLDLPRSNSSFTLASAYSESTQTLVPPPTPALSTPFPSTSQLSLPLALSPLAFTLASLPAHRTGPPPHLRAANNVYVQRAAAAITGAFVIDPALFVPDCLLPDDLDVLLIGGAKNAKGKGKRANLSLVTRSGDVCVDVWVREGSATRAWRRAESGSRDRGKGTNHGKGSSGVEESEDYWGDGWTSPPASHPWPTKTKSCADVDIRSESGSITLRIHAQSHQRLRIHLSSTQGTVSVGVPRSFMGSVFANSSARSDSADTIYLPASEYSAHFPTPGRGAEKLGVGGGGGGSIGGDAMQALGITPRQPVQFSEEMENVVTAVREQRKGAKGQYFVGNNPSQIISEHMGTRYIDELRVESRTIGVSFNDESPQQKSNGLITKLLNKAW